MSSSRTKHRGRAVAMCLAVTVLVHPAAVAPAGAEPAVTVTDPHAVFEQRCKSCHSEHGADMARLNLTLEGGALRVSRTGQPFAELLRRHHGVRVSEAETTSLVELMRRGLASGGAFQRRCASCHDKAVTLARDTLVLAEDGPRTRKAGRAVADLLASHGGATPDEIAILVDMLAWQLRTRPR